MAHETITADLTGVPETLLLTLRQRAMASRSPALPFADAEAERLFDAIDYPFEKFGKPLQWSVLRAAAIDERLRAWLRRYPDAQVVGLGEGLETQFERVDNGRVQWLSVDLPETIELRTTLLRSHPRHRELASSALDLRWMDGLDPRRPTFITAAGLLMYFHEHEVAELIGGIADYFSKAQMCFDVIPEYLSRLSVRKKYKSGDYELPAQPWGINRSDVSRIRAFHPRIAWVDAAPFPTGHGLFHERIVPFAYATPLGEHLLGNMVTLGFYPRVEAGAAPQLRA